MSEIASALARWQLDEKTVRERMYRAPTPHEHERWHAVWLLAQRWPAFRVAKSLERDPHTIGEWQKAFVEGGGAALVFEQTGGAPRPWHCPTGRSERSGEWVAAIGGTGLGELVLDRGAAVSPSTV